MANHASTRTTQLYDRRRDEVSLDEVERIVILASVMRSPIPFNPTPEMAEMRPMAAVR